MIDAQLLCGNKVAQVSNCPGTFIHYPVSQVSLSTALFVMFPFFRTRTKSRPLLPLFPSQLRNLKYFQHPLMKPHFPIKNNFREIMNCPFAKTLNI